MFKPNVFDPVHIELEFKKRQEIMISLRLKHLRLLGRKAQSIKKNLALAF